MGTEHLSRLIQHNVETEDIGDIDAYGIDWDDYEDAQIQAHHNAENQAPAYADNNPFTMQTSTHLNHVEVEVPNSPYAPEQLSYLQNELRSLLFFGFRSMDDHRLLWITGLQNTISSSKLWAFSAF